MRSFRYVFDAFCDESLLSKGPAIIKLGYSTYATQNLDVFEALPRIRAIGYEAIELAVGDDWPTAPHKLDAPTRARLVDVLRHLDLPPPVLFGQVSTCARGDERTAMRARFVSYCRLSQDLNYGTDPGVVTTTVSGPSSDWESTRQQIADDLVDLADLAADNNTTLAVEPHVGCAFDTPEKAVWMMERTGHSHLRLHFDHSHFHVCDIDLQHAADLCLPHTVHIHIKDGYMEEDKVTFLLPGDGTLDLVDYFAVLGRFGVDLPVCAEVSAMIWNRPDYEPWTAAESCYEALNRARQQAIS